MPPPWLLKRTHRPGPENSTAGKGGRVAVGIAPAHRLFRGNPRRAPAARAAGPARARRSHQPQRRGRIGLPGSPAGLALDLRRRPRRAAAVRCRRHHALRRLGRPVRGYRRAVEGHSPWAANEEQAQPIQVARPEQEPSLAQLLPELREEGIASLAFVPIAHQGRLLGKFMLYFDTTARAAAGRDPPRPDRRRIPGAGRFRARPPSRNPPAECRPGGPGAAAHPPAGRSQPGNGGLLLLGVARPARAAAGARRLLAHPARGCRPPSSASSTRATCAASSPPAGAWAC
jgi:hypothetical protein